MMTDEDLLRCAEIAFDIVAPEYEAAMGKPPRSVRAQVSKALARDMRKGLALVPEFAKAPRDRQLRVATTAACGLVRKLIDGTP
jgi:hypothetical protein